MKYLVILLMTITFLPAADYIDTFPIYVEGNAEYLAFFLNAAAMLVTNTEFLSLVVMAIILGGIVTSWQSLQGASLVPVAKSSVGILAGLAFLFAPVEVPIVDLRTEQGYKLSGAACTQEQGLPSTYQKVDNVPYIIALAPSVFTTLGYSLRELVKQASIPILNAFGETVSIEKVTSFASNAYTPEDMIKDSLKIVYSARSSNPALDEYRYYLTKYIKGCTLQNAAVFDVDLNDLYDPQDNLITSLNPANYGFENEEVYYHNYKDLNTTNETTCGAFYQKLQNDYTAYKTDLMSEIMSKLPVCIDMPAVADELVQSGFVLQGDDTNASSVSSLDGFASMKNFMAEASFSNSVIHAAEEFSPDTVALANRATAEQSKVKMMLEGAGAYNFTVTMIPKTIHFLFPIVVFLGIFVVISAMAQSYQKSIMIYVGYLGSFAIFELAKLAIVIVNAAVIYFESASATSKLLEFSKNGASIENLPMALSEISETTAIAGTVGTMLIFAIPMIIYRGNFFGLLSALGAPGQKYLGNDVETASRGATGRVGAEIAKEAILSDDMARKRLESMGFDTNNLNKGYLDTYNDLQMQISNASKGFGNMSTFNTIEDQSQGNYLTGVKQNSTTAQVGANANTMDAITSGQVMGDQIAGSMTGATKALEDGVKHDDLIKGAENQEAKKLGFQAGFGREGDYTSILKNALDDGVSLGASENKTREIRDSGMVTTEDGKTRTYDATKVGEGQALQKSKKEFEAMAAMDAISEPKTGEKNGLNDFLAGADADGRIATNATIGKGEQWQKYTDKEQIEEMAKVKANEAAKTFGSIDSSYEAIKAKGGVDDSIAFDAVSAKVKTATDVATMDKNLKVGGAEGGLSEESRKSLDDAVKHIAEAASTLAAGKTASGMESVSRADANYKDGGYIGLQKDSAIIQTDKTMGDIKGQQYVAENIEGQQDYINKALSTAKSPEERQAMINDLQRSGWTDENGTVNPDKFIEAKSMLSANNMTSHNSMGIGGKLVSGSIGGTGQNTTVKVDGQDVISDGMKIDTGGEVNSVIAQYKHLHGGKEPTVGQLVDFVKNSQMAEATKNNFFGNLSANIAEATGAEPEVVEAGLIAGGSALGAIGLNSMMGKPVNKIWGGAKNALSGNDSKTNQQSMNSSTKQSDNHSNSEYSNTTNNESAHKNSFVQDMDNLTKNHEKLSSDFKDIGEQKKALDAQYNNGKMSKETYDKKFNDLDTKQQDIVNQLEDIDQKKVDMEANAKHEAAMRGAQAKANSNRFSPNVKAGGFWATAGVVADLTLQGRIGDAYDMVEEGVVDTFDKAMDGKFTGKNSVASNLSTAIIGKEATNSLAENKFSVAGMQAATNAADAIGQGFDMASSGVAWMYAKATGSDVSYSQLRDTNFSITQSGANLVNSAVDAVSNFSNMSIGPAGGSGQVPGSSMYVPQHAQAAMSPDYTSLVQQSTQHQALAGFENDATIANSNQQQLKQGYELQDITQRSFNKLMESLEPKKTSKEKLVEEENDKQ